jgi:hypothetical protein
MIKILILFEQIGFLVQEDGTYIGYSFEPKHGLIKFEFKNHYLTCTTNNDTNPIVLFSIMYGELQLGVFLILLEEYKILQHDFIQKCISKAEKRFNKQFA